MTRGVESSTLPRLLAWKMGVICTLWSQLRVFSTFFGVEAKVGVEATCQQYQCFPRYHTFHAYSELKKYFFNLEKKSISVEAWKRGYLE